LKKKKKILIPIHPLNLYILLSQKTLLLEQLLYNKFNYKIKFSKEKKALETFMLLAIKIISLIKLLIIITIKIIPKILFKISNILLNSNSLIDLHKFFKTIKKKLKKINLFLMFTLLAKILPIIIIIPKNLLNLMSKNMKSTFKKSWNKKKPKCFIEIKLNLKKKKI
jgi:hypothetical protein